MIPGSGEESPLAGLRRRLEARRPLLDESGAPRDGDGPPGDDDPDRRSWVPELLASRDHASGGEEHAGADTGEADPHGGGAPAAHELLLVDLVSYDGCQRAAPEDPQTAAALFLRFARDTLGRPAPSDARRAADAARRVPAEELGLYVAPRPRVNDSSLYKLEQRLAHAVKLDGAALARRARGGVSTADALPVAAAAAAARWWFGADGLMVQEPSPLKAHKERPHRRWDQDEAATAAAFLPAAVHAGGAADQGRSYRLDIEVGRMEFFVHPLMAWEHQLAAKLLSMYREYKRRQAVRLVPFYVRRLAALEDALLRAREELFTASDAAAAAAASGASAAAATVDETHGGRGSPSQQQRQRRRGPNGGGGPGSSLQDQSARSSGEGIMSQAARLEGLVTRCVALEEEVAEARQLRKEEQALLAATVEAMRRVWDRLRAVRAQQGRAVTDLQMALVPQAGVGEEAGSVGEEETVPVQQDGLTRKDLDVALALAEAETIAGLPDWPASFAADQRSQKAPPEDGEAAVQAVAGFKPRRVECMCTAHAAARAELVSRLAVLKGRVSCDPQDPELRALEDRLTALGPAPRRAARPTSEQAAAARARLQAAAAKRQTAVEPVLTTLDGEARVCSGSGGTVAGPKFIGRCRYYARLLINGRVVGASRVVAMCEDFTVDFRDVFSVRVLKWPESLELQLWEQGTLADRQLATLYLPVPGSGGTPHIDPQPRPLSWAGPEPVPRQELEKAAALLHGGAAPVPAVADTLQRAPAHLIDAGTRDRGAAAAATTGAVSQRRRRQRVGESVTAGSAGAASQAQAAEEEEVLEEEPESAGGDTEGDAVPTAAGAMGPSADDAGEGSAPIFPSGVIFVRSGWVPEAGLSAVGIGAFGGALAKDAACEEAVAAVGSGGFDAGDATATLTLVRPFAGSPQPAPPVAGGQWRLYDNPLSSDTGGGGGSAADWGSGKLSTGNRLQQKGPSAAEFGGSRLSTMKRGGGPGWDAETAPELMPPRPAVTRDQALRRAVVGSGKGSRAAAAEWLARHPADPNDPRNADLLELMRAREAAAAGLGAPSDRFRLGVPPDLAMPPGDRASDRRAAFLRRRWEAGVLRRGDRGAERIVAPLAAGDGVDQQHDRMRALAALEAAALGLPAAELLPSAAGPDAAAAAGGAAFEGEDVAVGGLLVAPPGERRERAAARWASGALARALEARQQRIRDFALRLRGAGRSGPSGGFGGVCGGGNGGRRLRTDDVVKDAALPEFRLDLSSLAALLQPARPLRPRRRMVRKITAAVPRETALVVTLQRAGNLPARLPLGPGGAGPRLTASPVRGAANRIQGSAWGSPSARDRPGVTGSPGGPSLAARATSDWETGGPGWEDVEGDPLGGDGGLSVFVEVAFRGTSRRTVAVDSAAPIWNEQVAFPVFDLNEDASPMALRESEGIVTISLFDEVLTPAAAQRLERARALRGTASSAGAAAATAANNATGPGANVAAWEALTEGGGSLPERERRFLGCMRVPLAAIYQAESIEGTFKLEVPPVILGYYQPAPQPPTLSAFITLRPRLAAPAPPDEERAPGEREDVARHAARWVAALRTLPQCRGRIVRAAAVDPDGLGTLLPRFLAAMRVPPAFESEAAALDPADSESAAHLMLGLARWVAAVPFLEDAAFRRAARVDIWCGNAEALALGGGDHEEHAHLLAGLFLAVGQEALVVLGTSLQGAAAAFVLTTGRLASAAGPADAPAAATQAASVPQPAAAAVRATGQEAPASAGGRHGDQQQQQQSEQQQAGEKGEQPQQPADPPKQSASQEAGQGDAPAAAAAGAPVPPPEVAAAPEDPGVWDVTRLRLWNPLTGGCVPVRDPACELREVGTVYDATNVWANVQSSGHPWDMSWNLSNSSAWRPFFGAALPPRELASMQVDPSYNDLEPRVYEELEARVEEAVRGALYDARSVVVTQPNSKLSRVLKALLRELPSQLSAIDTAGLEASIAMAEGAGAAAGVGQEALEYARGKLEERARLLKGLQVAHNDRVAREMRGCTVNGHVLALPFSDAWAAAASEAVLSTGVHRTVDPRVKFAMAAHVERLGAPWVCRIWIYVAAIRDAA